MARLLILGGTAEAADLAAGAVRLPGLEVITSLAGRTRDPRPLPGRVRTGGFGGALGLANFLEAERIDLVVDATHPFAATMSANAALACVRTFRPRLSLLRPMWPRRPGDRWHEVGDAAETARLLARWRRRALLTVGQPDLEAFAGLNAVPLLVRSIERPAALPTPDALWLSGRGPFALADELALLREHRVEVLVTKASGGDATYPKIEAARLLGLPVVIIRRPPPPAGEVAPDAETALAWIAARLAAPALSPAARSPPRS